MPEVKIEQSSKDDVALARSYLNDALKADNAAEYFDLLTKAASHLADALVNARFKVEK